MTATTEAARQGARNLLAGCAGAVAGERLAILYEDPGLGYYGEGLAEVVDQTAQELGLSTRLVEVPFTPAVEAIAPAVAEALAGADHALFLARLGDQLRFRDLPSGARPIVSYALDVGMLASPFGCAPHHAFVELKQALDAEFAGAERIRVTCPLGTDITGRVRPPAGGVLPDVTVRRFPMSVFAPLCASGFSGKVAVAQILCGTGSRYYAPYGITLDSPVFAGIEGGRLVAWSGPERMVERARKHYEHVATLNGIDRDFIHSWHAGIHPGCAYTEPAAANFERWSGSAFGNPRLMHVHTCGAYAPGEICWNVVDPTIEVDGRAIWKAGRIMTEEVPTVRAVLARFPEVAPLFAAPATDIGL